MTQLLTNSRMRTFRECPKKHALSYIDGWKPAVEPEALRFGSLIHTALEAYWNCLVDTREMTEFGHDDYKYLAYEAALAAIEGKATDAFEQARADEMVGGYCKRWLQEDVPAYEVLAVEPQFETPLWNPMTNAESRTWRLAGKIDAILRRRETGEVMVREFKTSSEDISDASNYWSRLALDPQVSMYCIGAEALGHQVSSIMYDVAKKPMLRPLLATPVEQRKFTKDGRLYATQREHDETAEEYRLRVREAIASDPDVHFKRRIIPRTMSQIREFLMDAWQQSRTMREMELDGFSPRSPESCFRFGQCWAWSLCSTGSKPEDFPTEFVKKDNVNQELSP